MYSEHTQSIYIAKLRLGKFSTLEVSFEIFVIWFDHCIVLLIELILNRVCIVMSDSVVHKY